MIQKTDDEEGDQNPVVVVDLNKTVPENPVDTKNLLNADLASLSDLSQDQLAKVPFKMPKPGFDLSNPILNLPDEDEESLMQTAINKSKS